MASDDAYSGASRQPDLAMRDELTTQLSLAPARFVVVNTAGVVELEKRRPVDSSGAHSGGAQCGQAGAVFQIIWPS